MNTKTSTTQRGQWMKAGLKSLLPAWLLGIVALGWLLTQAAQAADGTAVWTNRYNGLGNSAATAMAVHGSGNVFVTGYSPGNDGFSDYATIKYSSQSLPSIITTSATFDFASKQFRFTLTGPPGSNAIISASTNLQNWTPLDTNPLTGGSLNFTDTLATNFTRRFYRANLQ